MMLQLKPWYGQLCETGTSSRELYAVAARKGAEDSASEESSSEMYCFCATMVESVMNELAIRKTLLNNKLMLA